MAVQPEKPLPIIDGYSVICLTLGVELGANAGQESQKNADIAKLGVVIAAEMRIWREAGASTPASSADNQPWP
jgi:hypothetical protein